MVFKNADYSMLEKSLNFKNAFELKFFLNRIP